MVCPTASRDDLLFPTAPGKSCRHDRVLVAYIDVSSDTGGPSTAAPTGQLEGAGLLTAPKSKRLVIAVSHTESHEDSLAKD